MWAYIHKDGTKYAIPYYNIDYIVKSIGKFTEKHSNQPKKNTYYHSIINQYFKDEVLTILYRKNGDFDLFIGEEAFNELVITPEYKFVCKDN